MDLFIVFVQLPEVMGVRCIAVEGEPMQQVPEMRGKHAQSETNTGTGHAMRLEKRQPTTALGQQLQRVGRNKHRRNRLKSSVIIYARQDGNLGSG